MSPLITINSLFYITISHFVLDFGKTLNLTIPQLCLCCSRFDLCVKICKVHDIVSPTEFIVTTQRQNREINKKRAKMRILMCLLLQMSRIVIVCVFNEYSISMSNVINCTISKK